MNKIIKNIYIILFLISIIFFIIKAKILYKYKGWFYKSILLVLSGIFMTISLGSILSCLSPDNKTDSV